MIGTLVTNNYCKGDNNDDDIEDDNDDNNDNCDGDVYGNGNDDDCK